jgi:adenylyl-sulfate kinase
MPDKRRNNDILWHTGQVTREVREDLVGQQGCVVWLTGLSGSGKSTIAFRLEHDLVQLGRLSYVLDGDNIRHGLNADLGFEADDRTENIRRIGEVGALFADCGIITIASFVSPYRADRNKVRSRSDPGRFFEVLVDAPIEVCEDRDPKGLYKKARAGELENFTGISAPYERPERPELVIETDRTDPVGGAQLILDLLRSEGIIPDG